MRFFIQRTASKSWKDAKSRFHTRSALPAKRGLVAHFISVTVKPSILKSVGRKRCMPLRISGPRCTRA